MEEAIKRVRNKVLSGSSCENVSIWGLEPEQIQGFAEKLAEALEDNEDLLLFCYDLAGCSDSKELMLPLCRSLLSNPKLDPATAAYYQGTLPESIPDDPQEREDVLYDMEDQMKTIIGDLTEQGKWVLMILYHADAITPEVWDRKACAWLRKWLDPNSGELLFSCAMVGEKELKAVTPLPREGSPLWNVFERLAVRIAEG